MFSLDEFIYAIIGHRDLVCRDLVFSFTVPELPYSSRDCLQEVCTLRGLLVIFDIIVIPHFVRI